MALIPEAKVVAVASEVEMGVMQVEVEIPQGPGSRGDTGPRFRHISWRSWKGLLQGRIIPMFLQGKLIL